MVEGVNMCFAKYITMIVAPIVFFAAVPAFAVGRCPDTADRLQDFAYCLAPLPGGYGARYIGTYADLDDDHQELLTSMQTMPVIPPQVMPVSPMMYPFYPYYAMMGAYYNPYFSVRVAIPPY